MTWRAICARPYDLVPNIVKATLGIYTACLDGLLPTPSKSHYTFNLRDLARVVQGMMLMSKVRTDEYCSPRHRISFNSTTRFPYAFDDVASRICQSLVLTNIAGHGIVYRLKQGTRV